MRMHHTRRNIHPEVGADDQFEVQKQFNLKPVSRH